MLIIDESEVIPFVKTVGPMKAVSLEAITFIGVGVNPMGAALSQLAIGRDMIQHKVQA